MATKKYYVVWQGKQTGIFKDWKSCKKQVEGYAGAQYKSFTSKAEAEKAFTKSYNDYKGQNTTQKKTLSKAELVKYGTPIENALAVDAASSGNPGIMEYRGVYVANKQQLFHLGPFPEGTNNIGEFLALVHGLAYLKQKKIAIPVYSDSKIAISWVRQKVCKTKLTKTSKNKALFELVHRAENWLKSNTYNTTILKWETKAWGEIPADFGRK